MNFDKLTSYFDYLIDRKDAAGLDCIVFHKHKLVYRHMAGYADIENNVKISEETIYKLYSATKVVTCAAALMLYEQGKFMLTDPLYKFLPEFENMQKLTEDNTLIPVQKHITIKDLFCMTAGFTYDLNSPSLLKFREDTNYLCPTGEMTKFLANEPILFEPGEHWHYSLCHDVLAVLIEKISGMTFGEFLKKNIFLPLGMSDTFFHMTDKYKHRLAKIYNYDSEADTMVETAKELRYKLGDKYESGGAGLYSTVNDYAKFNEALCSDGIILSKNTINLMKTNFLNETQLVDYAKANMQGYGYGLGVRTLIDKTALGMNSPIGEFGGGGAIGTHNIIDLDNELTLFFARSMGNPNYYINNTFTNILYSCM